MPKLSKPDNTIEIEHPAKTMDFIRNATGAQINLNDQFKRFKAIVEIGMICKTHID